MGGAYIAGCRSLQKSTLEASIQHQATNEAHPHSFEKLRSSMQSLTLRFGVFGQWRLGDSLLLRSSSLLVSIYSTRLRR